MCKLIKFISAVLPIVMFFGCSSTPSSTEVFSDNPSANIYIGVAYPKNLQGLQLANEEINTSGGVLNRNITLVIKDDQGSVTTGTEVAQSFAEDKRLSAVIRHWNSRVSIPAATIYSNAGLPMITAASTSPALTSKGFNNIFRNIASDSAIGNNAAQYAASKGYKKTAIYYSDDEYGRSLANVYEDKFRELGQEVVDRICSVTDFDTQKTFDRWRAFGCDSVFVVEEYPKDREFIRKLRQNGFIVPVIGGLGTDSSGFVESLGKYAENVTILDIYNPQRDSTELKEFIAKFKSKYNTAPDAWAVQGYESVKLVAWAISKAGNARPESISEALRNLKDWNGVTGQLTCKKNGDIVGSYIYFKQIVNGHFVYQEQYFKEE